LVTLFAFAAVPAVVGAADCNINSQTVDISQGANCAKGNKVADNLAGQGGIFQTVVNILLFLVGAVAVIMLVIGGLRYVTSNGDQNAVTGAKNTIMYAIIGIIVAFLAYAAVNFVITQLQQGTDSTT
jgi:multisubunit Na+/H+ antiporter MnhB subunit